MLLLFSIIHAVIRLVVTERGLDADARPRPNLLGALAATAAVIAVTSYLLRIRAPIGDELCRVALAQAPGWVAGFWLGIGGAERKLAGPGRSATRSRLTCGPVVLRRRRLRPDAGPRAAPRAGHVGVRASRRDRRRPHRVRVRVLIGLFRRRANHQGTVARTAGRAAFAAFVLHPAVLQGRWSPLPLRWNQQIWHFGMRNRGLEPVHEFEEAVSHPGIIHFLTASKPWHLDDRHPLKREYFRYLWMTDWRGIARKQARADALRRLKSWAEHPFRLIERRIRHAIRWAGTR